MKQIIIEDYLPNCLAIGIRLEEFWELNITKLQPFIKAEEIKADKRNYEMWLQGAYFHEAISVVIANAFSKGSRQEYPKEPFKRSKESKEQLIANEEILKQKIMAYAIKNKE